MKTNKAYLEEELQKYPADLLYTEQQLNEGYLSELAFWDKVKEVTKQLMDKAKQLWDRFEFVFTPKRADTRRGMICSKILKFPT